MLKLFLEIPIKYPLLKNEATFICGSRFLLYLCPCNEQSTTLNHPGLKFDGISSGAALIPLILVGLADWIGTGLFDDLLYLTIIFFLFTIYTPGFKPLRVVACCRTSVPAIV